MPNEICESVDCNEKATGFYVAYEWDEDLKTTVSVTGAYLCDTHKKEWGFEE
jgi:hypothetical protein